MKTQNNSLLEFGRGLERRLWGASSRGTLLFSRRLLWKSWKAVGQNPASCKCLNYSQPWQCQNCKDLPHSHAAAKPSLSPRSTLLPASRYLPRRIQPYHCSFTACSELAWGLLQDISLQEDFGSPSSSL